MPLGGREAAKAGDSAVFLFRVNQAAAIGNRRQMRIDEGDERRIKSILTLRLIGLSIVKIREALAVTIPEKSLGTGTRYAQILQEHFGDLCRKRNEIARQMVRTADILAELGEVVDEKVTSQRSCDTAAADPLEEEIRLLIA
jgi:DNA-binding transcriptional MerR regulator